jgi:hypothetical protein
MQLGQQSHDVCREQAEAAKAAINKLVDSEPDLTERPLEEKDVLADQKSQASVLLRNGINPKRSTGGTESMLASIMKQLNWNAGDEKLCAKVMCICIVLHFLTHAMSMTSYEALVNFLVLMGWLPRGLGVYGDDTA